MTQLPCESKLVPDPFTGRLMWVQWSKDRHLSSGVLLYGDSNNSFWYFSSWLHFWTRAWTCVLGRWRVELRRVARHAAWWMKGRKSHLVTGSVQPASSVGIWRCGTCIRLLSAVKINQGTVSPNHLKVMIIWVHTLTLEKLCPVFHLKTLIRI